VHIDRQARIISGEWAGRTGMIEMDVGNQGMRQLSELESRLIDTRLKVTQTRTWSGLDNRALSISCQKIGRYNSSPTLESKIDLPESVLNLRCRVRLVVQARVDPVQRMHSCPGELKLAVETEP